MIQSRTLHGCNSGKGCRAVVCLETSKTLSHRPIESIKFIYRLHHNREQLATIAAASPSVGAETSKPKAWDRPLLEDSAFPLMNKRILVTAPRQYAQKLCSKLTAAGARTIWLPGVKITQLSEEEDLERLDEGLRPLLSGAKPHYNFIAFTSKNGIYAVMQRLAILAGGMPQAIAALKGSGAALCALGADGQVLIDLGLKVHISPAEASTQGLVREMEASGAAMGASVLCPVPRVTGGLTEPAVVPRFLAALLAAGAVPYRMEAYLTTLGSPQTECFVEASLLKAGHVHAVALSSTAEAQGLLLAVGGREVFQAAVLEHKVLLAAHGPYTGASEVLGLSVDCVSKNFKTFDGLVSALELAFTAPGTRGNNAVPPGLL